MAGKSQIPQEILDTISNLRRNGKTIDEIVAHLQQWLPTPPSRSAVGRHTKNIDAVLSVHKASVEMSHALGKQLGDNENEATRALSEIITANLLQAFVAGDLEDSEKRIKILQNMSRAVSDIAKAQHLDVNTVAKIRDEAEKKALVDAANRVKTVTENQGLSEKAKAEILQHLAG